jgi:hypothetical protein
MSKDAIARTTVPDEDAPASLHAILARVAQPVWVVDHDGKIMFANQAELRDLAAGIHPAVPPTGGSGRRSNGWRPGCRYPSRCST